jgi:Family of unknown function (DUF5317)
MLLASLIVLLFASVPLTGGRLARLADLQFRGVRWLGACLVVQVAIIVVVPEGDTAVHRVAHVATYAAAAVFLWANRRVPGMLVLGAGGMLNAVAIAANGGVMPASRSALRDAGVAERAGDEFINSAPVADAKLQFLGDVLAVPSWIPGANVFSVGDVLLLAGAAILLHRTCRGRAAAADAPARIAPAT